MPDGLYVFPTYQSLFILSEGPNLPSSDSQRVSEGPNFTEVQL